MSRPQKVGDEERILCYQIMLKNQFIHTRRQQWLIWASAHQPCPDCKADTRQPCRNMVDLKKMPREEARINRNPHDSRINWKRLLEGLQKRGLDS